MSELNLTSFENAINSLKSILERYYSENDIDIRDAVIQRFEYTYSLALKMIKRYLARYAYFDTNIDGMTFNEMIRAANLNGLLRSNLEVWDNYRQARNKTSHTYDEGVAKDVVAIIPDFAVEAECLLKNLKEKV